MCKMKKSTILGSLVLGALLIAVGSTGVQAAEVAGQKGETTTIVKIKDNSDPTNPTDPLNPAAPDQKMLTLEKVPSGYTFESKLQNNQYTISSGTITDPTVDVFNDRIDREWSVKAAVLNNKITRSDAKDFTVDSFKINDKEVSATGADGVVAKAQTSKTEANNTGVVKTPITAISIGFTDKDKVLKVGDQLDGKIQYQLYNTADAK